MATHLDALPVFWATEGARKSPVIARDAQVLLGVLALSAVLERDFSTAGRLSRLDAAYVEICFLNGNYNMVLVEVKSFAHATRSIPKRLTNPQPTVLDE